MQADFTQLPDGHTVDCELCVVGAGAAGIAIAREYIGSATSVCLLESGGLEFEEDTQALYQGQGIGTRPPRDLEESRLRFLGGTTNHWGGDCAPLNEIDFEKRPWVQHSGWPIKRSHLEPFYDRAQVVCELGPNQYGQALWRDLEVTALPFDSRRIETRFFQTSPPTNFSEVHAPALQRAENINILLHANVLGFRTNANGLAVTHVDIATLGGKRGRVRAKYFVLACGGIENARLLLNSDEVKPAGLGNDRDLVGRFYTDHLFGRLARAWSAEPKIWEHHGLSEHDHAATATFTRPSGERARVRPFACLSRDWQRREGVLNIGLLAEEPEEDSGAVPVARDDGRPLRYRVNLIGQSETAPNPDSRIKLLSERDALGMRQIQVDWRLSQIDLRTQKALATAFGIEMARLNIARVRIDNWVEKQDWTNAVGREGEPLTGSAHHMGTTRMSNTPSTGVVDTNCAIHDMANLYIAGSSVFPTSGFANPTLTIVALALRLADHLKQRLG